MIIETERLRLRRMSEADAEFIRRLVNDPSFVRNIGDKGVRTLADAQRYIREGPMASYARHGFGLNLVELKADGAPAGMCGLLKRDVLDHPDIGYAFVPEFWGAGYAREAASAVMEWARDSLGLSQILAITNPDNAASIRLLETIGFRFERMQRMPGESADVAVYAWRDRPRGAVDGSGAEGSL